MGKTHRPIWQLLEKSQSKMFKNPPKERDGCGPCKKKIIKNKKNQETVLDSRLKNYCLLLHLVERITCINRFT